MKAWIKMCFLCFGIFKMLNMYQQALYYEMHYNFLQSIAVMVFQS